MSVEPVDQRTLLLVVGLLLAAGPIVARAELCQVDADASGAGDGSSWADAYTDLQPALMDPDCTEIWVAAGLYKPGTATTDTFQLQSGVALYGGFAGTESSRDERDVVANVTVLSGDIGNDDITDTNGVVTNPGDQNGIGDQNGNNAEHVVTAGGTDGTAVLDGFTITAGHGDLGSGIYNVGGSPTLANLTFRGNRIDVTASFTGGAGLYNQGSASQPVELAATNFVFRDNFARDGAGIMNFSHTTLSLTGSTFRDNRASTRGGAIISFGSVDLAISASTFHDNTAQEGGAIYSQSLTFFPPPGGSLAVTGSTFRRNRAFLSGGAIRTRGVDVVVQGSTFEENSARWQTAGAGSGGAIYMGIFNTSGASAQRAGRLFLTNSTFSENYAEHQGGAVAVECEDIILDPDAIQMNHLTFRFNDVGLQGRGGAIANLDDQTSGNNSGCFDFGINNSILWLNRINSEIYNDGPQAKPVIRNSIVWRSFGSGPDWNDAYGHDGGGNLDAHPWFDHLGDRGGPTETIAIRPTSFAIDSAHPDFCPPTDQRGVPRMQDGDGDGVPACDMGAFEVVLPTPVLGSPVGSSTGTSPIPVTIDFDLPVEEFDVTDLVVGNGTAGNFAGSGDSYTVEITPDGEGMVTVDVPFGAGEWPPGGWFENNTEPSQGHPSIAAEQFSILFDGTPPGVTLATPAPDPTNVAPIPLTITFTEPVTGFELADLSISNGIADNFAGSGDAYSVDITPFADGPVTVDLAASVVADAAGNGNIAATQLAITYDGTPPAPTLTSTAPDPTNAAPIPVVVTFDEPVTGFDLADLLVDNGVVDNFTGSGTAYAFDVTPTGDGLVTVDVVAGAADDAAGNASTSTSFTILYDATAPVPTLGTAVGDPTNASPIPVMLTFSEPVTGFGIADIAVSNGAAGNLTGSDDAFSFDITPSADGPVTVDVAAGAATDGAGNGNVAAIQLTITYDSTPPTPTLASTATDPTNASPIPVEVTFDEAVTGFDLAGVIVDNGVADNFSGSGVAYAFDVIPTGDGLVTVDVIGGAADDAAGNASTSSSFTILYDATAPVPTLATAVGDPTNASPIPVDVTFDEPVTGFDLTGVTVDNGTAGNLVGSGAAYTFDVIPAADGTVTVDIAAGAATDAAGNISTMTGSLARIFDGSPPTVVSTSLFPSYSGFGPVLIDVHFSELMYNPDGDIDPDDVTNPANYLLVGAGNDGTFETTSCADGAAPGDDSFPVDRVSWDSTSLMATISLLAPPNAGDYRLFICGTTSLRDPAGNLLNGGADATAGFGVGIPLAVPAFHPAGLLLLVLLFALAGSRDLLCRHYHQQRTKP